MSPDVNDVDLDGAPATGAPLGASLEPRLMAKALGALFAAGATLALLTAALPHSPRASELGLLLIVGAAYLVAGLLSWRARRASWRVLQLALGWGSTLIAGVAYFSAQSAEPAGLLLSVGVPLRLLLPDHQRRLPSKSSTWASSTACC